MTGFTQGLQQPSLDETLKYSNLRQICAFFLGSIFLCGAHYLTHRIFQLVVDYRYGRSLMRQVSDGTSGETEVTHWQILQAEQCFASRKTNLRNDFFAATISMCIALASLFHFISLLALNAPGNGCSFSIAAAGIVGDLGKSVGLVALLVELWEHRTSVLALLLVALCGLAALACSFVSNSIGVGVLDNNSLSSSLQLCHRKYFLPTSIAGMILFAVGELSVAAQLLQLLMAHQNKMDKMLGATLARSLALLVLEVLSLPLNLLPRVDPVQRFIPLTIGSLLVLYAFNIKINECVPIESTVTAERSNPGHIINISECRPSSTLTFDMQNHPYARTEKERRVIPLTARSSQTVDSDYVQSVRAAVVQIALRRPRLSNIPDPSSLPVPPKRFSGLLTPNVSPVAPSSTASVKTSESERYTRALSGFLVHDSALGGLAVEPKADGEGSYTGHVRSRDQKGMSQSELSNAVSHGFDVSRLSPVPHFWRKTWSGGGVA